MGLLHAGACGCVQVATKITSKQSLLVRNVGNRATQFLLTASEHFDVSPAEGSLEPGEFMQVCMLHDWTMRAKKVVVVRLVHGPCYTVHAWLPCTCIAAAAGAG
jgi:hypothetical protein